MKAMPEEQDRLLRAVGEAQAEADRVEAEAKEVARRIREQAVRLAYDAGVPVPSIAQKLKVTRQRVYQILGQ